MKSTNKYPDDVLPVWYSELNYYMTKYGAETLDELDQILWFNYGNSLHIIG